MKNRTLLLLLFAASACVSKNDSENTDIESGPMEAAMKMSKNMQESAEKIQKNMEEGKDVKAIPYEDLITYLPTSIDGYERSKEPKGQSVDMQGMSYSSAEVAFKNGSGNRIDISLLDYYSAYSMYTMATAMWGSGLKINTSDEMAQSVSLGDDIKGWETFKKKSNHAALVLGIGDRFILTIEGDNQKDTEKLKSIAKSININALAELD